jgi:ABC-type multidrug transport system fused ATPase/permease subunit
VTFSLERGKRYALVGESGSGKTTLLKIIRDLHHPSALSLRVDGQEVPDGFPGISRAISLVPQDPEIFSQTIWENITLGADYDEESVHQAAEWACFSEVVGRLPRGYESSIKEKGVNLSGGEQQRLALARGLLACQDKDVVLLDEPTASLDPVTEMKIYQNIFRVFRGKTIVSSIHRLHLLSYFDQIFLFERGRIVARGNLAELLAQSSEFRVMWQEYHRHAQKEVV